MIHRLLIWLGILAGPAENAYLAWADDWLEERGL